MGAGLRQNLGPEWGPEIWRRVTQASPNKVLIDVTASTANSLANDKKRKATDPAKEQRRKSKYLRVDDTPAARKAYDRHDDGISPDDTTADVSPSQLQIMVESYYDRRVKVSEKRVEEIEASTREQSDSDQWRQERRQRITASKVGSIAKMRETTRRSKKVEEILYTNFRGNEATRYGSLNESTATSQYITHQNDNGHPGLTVQQCGLFVSHVSPWLAATPDGLVTDPSCSDNRSGLLEVKNPFGIREETIDGACSNKTFCLEKKGSKYQLKRKHGYYYQVQCQLYCTNESWCDFVVRTTKDIHVERIYRDRKWWEIQLTKLNKFYFTALLPELACPRHRNGGIREPVQHHQQE